MKQPSRERTVLNRLLKRTIDIVGASGGLVILGFPMIAVAVTVRLKLGSPIIFKQTRPGRFARPFTLYKFRTMTESDGSHDDSERLTRLGIFLRRASLDELPELFNVLRGDMSLVGPRPLLMEYVERYSPEQSRRHEVSPGITGWAQVNGRNALTWDDKFKLDVWYVDNWSLALDAKILAMTAWKVVTGQGISAQGFATMPKFIGHDSGDAL